MNRIYYLFSFFLLLFSSCEKNDIQSFEEESGVTIRLFSLNPYNLRIVDEDNLEIEQTVKNISLFFTEPSTNAIVYKYAYTGFRISGDYQFISLPLEPADLLTKDVYVIANYDNEPALNAVNTVDDLKGLFTPIVDKTNNLDPANGLCMYGFLPNFDFTAGEDAVIGMERTCAKIRINLTFPENTNASQENTFLIQHAANHTFVIENPSSVLPQTDYFNFAAFLPLRFNGTDTYSNIVYVYEASDPPIITLNTNLTGENAINEFTTRLPVPVRNYLYDLTIEILEEDTDNSIRSYSGKNNNRSYLYKSSISVYNGMGELVDLIQE